MSWRKSVNFSANKVADSPVRSGRAWIQIRRNLITRTVGALFCASLSLWLSVNRSHAAEAAAETPIAQLQLFNGKNLTGFYSWLVDTKREDPRCVFSVTNGMIKISGEGLGYLSTDKAYRNYHLIAEFRWGRTNWHWGQRVGAARDSGIFLHATGPDGNSHDGGGAFKAAIECQVMQGAVGDFLLIRGTAADGSFIAPQVTVETSRSADADGWPTWQAGGTERTLTRWGRVNWKDKARDWRDTLDFRGARDVESAGEGWTTVECLCDGQRIEVRVNGVVVNAARSVSPSRGRILLQCEGSEVFVRRLELKPLAIRKP